MKHSSREVWESRGTGAWSQKSKFKKVAAPERTESAIKFDQNTERKLREIFWTLDWQETGQAVSSLAGITGGNPSPPCHVMPWVDGETLAIHTLDSYNQGNQGTVPTYRHHYVIELEGKRKMAVKQRCWNRKYQVNTIPISKPLAEYEGVGNKAKWSRTIEFLEWVG